jgi:hypothetical protein
VDLSSEAQFVLSKALSDRTKVIYFHYWKAFASFCKNHDIVLKLPVTDVLLVNFLASLVNTNYKVNTVAAHVSALSYINKLFGYSDFNQSFLVKQFLKGAYNISASVSCSDSRLPITSTLLRQIILALPTTVKNYIHRILFSTMCIVAFHAFLRIGEMCIKVSQNSSHVLQYSDVKIIQQNSITIGVEVTLRHYKHSKQPATCFLPANSADPLLCPVSAIQLYLSILKPCSGPFFQMPNRQPVSYTFFNYNLKNAINFLGFDSKRYKSHSFRIGAATNAAMQGFSDDSIKKMGRWKSNAMQKYIRLPQLKLVTPVTT